MASSNLVSYIAADPATKEAAVIDPVLENDSRAGEVDTRSVEAMLRFAKEQGYRVAWTLETHAHATICPAQLCQGEATLSFGTNK
jgi:glyoxylase-like metal-dependent hydrolase (beta-lactamase superfamily II)